MNPLPGHVLNELIDGSAEPLLVARIDSPEWPVEVANAASADLGADAAGQPFADVIEQLIGRDLALEISETVRAGQATTLPIEVGGREYLLSIRVLDGGDDGASYCAAWFRHPATQTGGGEAQAALATANRRIRDLTRDDPVTGLLNGATFREVLEHDWAVAQREKSTLALAVFGFDDFDAYLDVFGRHATDSCLRRVASVIRRSLRRASDVAARIDGEHGGRIVVLSHGSDEESVREFAIRIAAAVRELGLHHPRSRVSRFVTVSIDVTMLDASRDKLSVGKLLERLVASD